MEMKLDETRIKISDRCRPIEISLNLDFDLKRYVKGSTSSRIWHTALATWYTLQDDIDRELENV